MSASNTPTTDSTIRLCDGRVLGYAEMGKSDGFPIFYFHGLGSSRLGARLWAESATKLGVRLIALDRPGVGRSDLKAGYRLLDWPDDVVEVADQLGIERFAVKAVSAGGAYGLACAYKIPQRLTACGLVCAIAPGHFITKDAPLWMRAMRGMGEHLPWLYCLSVRLLMRATRSNAASIEKQLARSAPFLGESERKVLQNAETRGLLAQAFAECARQGLRGNVDEAVLLVEPWGFNVEEIAFEKIFLWHGAQDRYLPVCLAQALAEALPHCTATFYPHEGHFSTHRNHAEDILKTLSS